MKNEAFIPSHKSFHKVILILSIKCSFNFSKKKFYENSHSCKVFFWKRLFTFHDGLYFLQTGVEMEIIDEISLVEWLVNNFKSFGN